MDSDDESMRSMVRAGDGDGDDVSDDPDEDEEGDGDDEDEGDEDDDEDAPTVSRGGASSGDVLPVRARPALPSLSDPDRSRLVREIGHEAVWSLSTAKPGNGVEQIRDGSVDTYWQSDGGQPHLINIQFGRRAAVCEVAFYLDYNLDESYTPKRLSVRCGTTFHDLEEVRTVELTEPVGWCSVPLYRRAGDDPLDDDDADDPDEEEDEENEDEDELKFPLTGKRRPMRTHFVQICVASMHQNGRDTHVRQVKVFGPREGAVASVRNGGASGGDGAEGGWTICRVPDFRTVEMSQYSTIR